MPSRAALSAAAHAALEMLDITCGITLYNPSSPLAQNEGVKKVIRPVVLVELGSVFLRAINMFGASKPIKKCQPVHSNQSQHVDETLQIPPKTHLQRKAKRLHGKTEYPTVILAGLEKLPRLVCTKCHGHASSPASWQTT